MGMKFFSGESKESPLPPNPDPHLFKIVGGHQYGTMPPLLYSVIEVHYFGCTPYDGNKILVYAQTMESLKKCLTLDPHFLEYPRHSPVARFPANVEGRKDAAAFTYWKVNGRFP